MSARTSLPALMLSALLAACGGSGSHRRPARRAALPAAPPATTRATTATTGATSATTGATSATTGATSATTAPAHPAPPPPVHALLTAETENRLLVVDVPSGRVVGRIAVASDPEDIAVAGNGGTVVVVSAAAGRVTLLSGRTLRILKRLGGFDRPHIAAIAPDGRHAWVTDDARGTLTAIDLAHLRVTGTVHVGAGAHHMSFDLIHGVAWVALGESATTIVVLGTGDFGHPRVMGSFAPGFTVHDLAFSTYGQRFWLTSATSPEVTVFDSYARRTMFRVPVGAAPQHVALAGRYAYLTSGYGGTIEQVDASTGKLLARARSPYGSFELAADGRYVVTSSLLRGTLSIYTSNLKLLRVVHLAPATREVALNSPAG